MELGRCLVIGALYSWNGIVLNHVSKGFTISKWKICVLSGKGYDIKRTETLQDN